MTNTEGRIHDYLKSGVRNIFTKRYIFGACVSDDSPIFSFNLYERVAKVWILQLFDDTITTRKEPHSIISDWNEFGGRLKIFNSHELKCSSFLEVVCVPLYNTCIMCEIFHSIETRNNWIFLCVIYEFNNLVGCKHDI